MPRGILQAAIANWAECGANQALCGGADDEGLVLLCDTCNLPYHAQCVGFEGPVLGDWLCPRCENDREEEGSEDEP